MQEPLYRDYNSYLRQRFGCRVQKVTLDAGLTCPNRDGTLGNRGCVYCNDKGSGTGAARQGVGIREQLEAGKKALGKKYKAEKFLAYFQSFSNTYAPLARLQEIYEEALSTPDVVGLCIGTRPDCIPDPVLDYIQRLSQRALIWMEYGLQSAHESTLKWIRRGHGVAAFVDAVQRTRRRNLPVCAHVILGLPGEGLPEVLETARFLGRLDIQAVKIHALYVIKGTTLAKWHRDGAFRCLTREEYAKLVGEFLALLPPHIIIQRLTSDPHREELEAPLWALEKQQTLKAIRTYMTDRGLVQGRGFATHAHTPHGTAETLD